jgi:tRNA G10  N-methylase Trm11
MELCAFDASGQLQRSKKESAVSFAAFEKVFEKLSSVHKNKDDAGDIFFIVEFFVEPSAPLPININLIEPQPAWVMFCRRLGCGPAADRKGAMSSSKGRRPRAGILETLALHKRRGTTATTMEPELALTMANLACVGVGSLVVDPFCGAGGLLVPSLYLGARSAVGVDASAFQADPLLADNVAADCAALGLSGLTLATGNMLDWRSPTSALAALLQGRRVDAIVTDPPYGVKAAAVDAPDFDGILGEKRGSGRGEGSGGCQNTGGGGDDGSNGQGGGVDSGVGVAAEAPASAAPASAAPASAAPASAAPASAAPASAAPASAATGIRDRDRELSGGKLDDIYQTASVQALYQSLLAFAAANLRPGGRLVTFVPNPFTDRRADDSDGAGALIATAESSGPWSGGTGHDSWSDAGIRDLGDTAAPLWSPKAASALDFLGPVPPELRLKYTSVQVFRTRKRNQRPFSRALLVFERV